MVRVSETRLINQRRILGFAAVVEAGTGLLLILVPAFVVALLLGSSTFPTGMAIARLAGFALLALALASWPGRQRAESGSPALWGMLVYNTLVALYLAHLGAYRHVGGLLLWPAVAVHAIVALLLFWTWRVERRTQNP